MSGGNEVPERSGNHSEHERRLPDPEKSVLLVQCNTLS